MPFLLLSNVLVFQNEIAMYISQHSARTAVPRASHGASRLARHVGAAMASSWQALQGLLVALQEPSGGGRYQSHGVPSGHEASERGRLGKCHLFDRWRAVGMVGSMQLPRGVCVVHAALGRDTHDLRRHR